MPFKSKAQARMMFATNPEIAKEMAHKTKSFSKLPNKISIYKDVAAKKRKRGKK